VKQVLPMLSFKLKLIIYFIASVLNILTAGNSISSDSFPIVPPRTRGDRSVEPIVTNLILPHTKRYSPYKKGLSNSKPPAVRKKGLSSPNLPTITIPPGVTDVPIPQKEIFDRLVARDFICFSLLSLFDAEVTDDISQHKCSSPVANKTHTVLFQILACQNSKICEFELLGKSEELALRDPRWVERHRFFVQIAFDGKETMSLTVQDYEPMLRTTPELQPTQEELFEDMDNDSALRVFQEIVSNSISDKFRLHFSSYTPE
jgi:hypothetical protein